MKTVLDNTVNNSDYKSEKDEFQQALDQRYFRNGLVGYKETGFTRLACFRK